MGVYINMEMPKNCSECEFGKPTINCILTWKSYNWGLTHRPSDCPLVEMKDDHYYIMRDGTLYKARVATPEEMGAKTINVKEYIENGDK